MSTHKNFTQTLAPTVKEISSKKLSCSIKIGFVQTNAEVIFNSVEFDQGIPPIVIGNSYEHTKPSPLFCTEK